MDLRENDELQEQCVLDNNTSLATNRKESDQEFDKESEATESDASSQDQFSEDEVDDQSDEDFVASEDKLSQNKNIANCFNIIS